MNSFVCQPLAKQHDRQAFRCGVDELDQYLQRRAGQDMRRRVAAVFVMVPQDELRRIVGYYSLSSASLLLSELPDEMVKRLPRYPALPAVLIGRLARDLSFPGAGKLLLLDALARAWRHSADVAASLVLVDAYNRVARGFYARYGFQEMLQERNRMFLPIKTVEALLILDGHGD
jgi:GNAT superfamily N-acetyltransferase